MSLSTQSIRRPSWDAWYLANAYWWAQRSRDPSTKVGAVISRPNHTVASVGYNDFPRGETHEPWKYLDRSYKLGRIIHAEANAIENASESCEGHTLYVTFHPCSRCAEKIAASKIACVVIPDTAIPERWRADMDEAAEILAGAGVEVRRIKQVQALGFDLVSFLHRKRMHSLETWPTQTVTGVLDHISKEVREIAADPSDLSEWVDLTLLALDGAMRAGHDPFAVVTGILDKQGRNEGRNWPAPHTADPNKAIEHIRDSAE